MLNIQKSGGSGCLGEYVEYIKEYGGYVEYL